MLEMHRSSFREKMGNLRAGSIIICPKCGLNHTLCHPRKGHQVISTLLVYNCDGIRICTGDEEEITPDEDLSREDRRDKRRVPTQTVK